MTQILVLNSSANGPASVSHQLADELVGELRKREPEITVVERDLGHEPAPHFRVDEVAALRRGEREGDALVAVHTRADAYLAEVQAADVLVIGSPMYNFGISSPLKAWFDHIIRAGLTFSYGATGPQGLLQGKRAIVVESRGGIYSQGPAQAMDHQEPHLRTLLGFVGITDVSFVRAEGMDMGPEARDAGLATARSQFAAALAA